uniref:Mandelate racemase/muconate lactonizing enzyme C-terminal domain-containing protein n=1 Tax=Strigamia maritima TaxID=126957 RepID=T1IW37_STRMM
MPSTKVKNGTKPSTKVKNGTMPSTKVKNGTMPGTKFMVPITKDHFSPGMAMVSYANNFWTWVLPGKSHFPEPSIQILIKPYYKASKLKLVKMSKTISVDAKLSAKLSDGMVDANQRWDVPTAIEWMSQLAQFHPLWIEEPTSPDDILGHATISKALQPMGICVATGEQCHNKVMFKQFLQSGGMQFCQIDSCRLGGVNEILAVLLMAKKLNVPVCPHAGGVGLCELVQHLMFFDYICITGTTENRMIEYVDHLHQHFQDPVVISNACYMAPKNAGYSASILDESLSNYEYPSGAKWQEMFSKGIFPKPTNTIHTSNAIFAYHATNSINVNTLKTSAGRSLDFGAESTTDNTYCDK